MLNHFIEYLFVLVLSFFIFVFFPLYPMGNMGKHWENTKGK